MLETATRRPLHLDIPHKKISLTWQRIALLAVLLLSALLEFLQLDQEGYANTYYAAGVKSMLTSWHNFFFVSFDSGGFVTLDKPPLGFWIEAASAKLFGFSGWSLLFPEALAGVLSVALLYYLVTRIYGQMAGLIAALVLALTPIVVVTDRNNTVDSLLILALLLGVWAVIRATETGRLRWLLLSAVFVGLGFNIKMLQAYLVVPAFAIVYFSGAPQRWFTRLGHLALAAVVLLLVSLSWALIVDVVPASQRPFVSDSGTNSELSLILGYNGLGRLSQSLTPTLEKLDVLSKNIDLNVTPAFAPNIGNPGPLRLFSQELGGQISWLLPLAILALLIAVLRIPWRREQRQPLLPLNKRAQGIVLWGTWLFTTFVYFSVSRFFHPYYLVMLAPAIAALAGIALALLWDDYLRGSWRGWLLPVTLLGSIAVQAYILGDGASAIPWLLPVAIAGDLCAAVILVIVKLVNRAGGFRQRLPLLAVVLGLFALLVIPSAWDISSVVQSNGGAWLPEASLVGQGSGFGGRPGGGQFAGRGPGGGQFNGGNRGFGNGQQGRGMPPGAGNLPSTGNTGNSTNRPQGGGLPGGGRGFGGGGMTISGAQWNILDKKLVSYLEGQRGNTRYLVATTTSSYASIFMLDSDTPAIALGGYQGWDRIVTPTQLAQMVKNGTVRFFYISSSQGNTAAINQLGAGGQNGANAQGDVNGDLEQWVQTSCKAVSQSLWQTQSSTSGSFGQAGNGGMQLYDCAPAS